MVRMSSHSIACPLRLTQIGQGDQGPISRSGVINGDGGKVPRPDAVIFGAQ